MALDYSQHQPAVALGLPDYSAEFEWPEDGNQQQQSASSHFRHDSESRPTRPVALNSTFLRLTVISSAVLSRRAVALIDSFDEVSIGRDRCSTPRLRLKELAVSKYHASVYWDSQTKQWSLVDMGSTHGTHLISPDSAVAQASGSVSDQGYTLSSTTRLSPPKSASLPQTLSHLQHIVVGGTTLVVHMHADRIPCDACAVAGHILIDLNPSIGKPNHEPKPANARSLQVLKRDLLSRPAYAASAHERTRPGPVSEPYIDRAELRRQRYPGWRDPNPPRESDQPQATRVWTPDAARSLVTNQGPNLQAAAPIPLNNMGHKLLTKKGWTPGSVLGSQPETGIASVALTEPLVPRATTNRRGLGMSTK